MRARVRFRAAQRGTAVTRYVCDSSLSGASLTVCQNLLLAQLTLDKLEAALNTNVRRTRSARACACVHARSCVRGID